MAFRTQWTGALLSLTFGARLSSRSLLNGDGISAQLNDLVTALGLSAAQLGLPVVAL
jgi:hypothetical protein